MYGSNFWKPKPWSAAWPCASGRERAALAEGRAPEGWFHSMCLTRVAPANLSGHWIGWGCPRSSASHTVCMVFLARTFHTPRQSLQNQKGEGQLASAWKWKDHPKVT